MTWQTSYYHYDGQGSTLCLTDENGEITDSYAYTAFGEELDTGAANPTRNPFRWLGQSGYYRDADTEDYYVRARVYRPALARWLSEDPISYLAEMNLYAYVDENPVSWSDPSGCVAALINGLGNVDPNWAPAEKALKKAGHTVRIFRPAEAALGLVAQWIRGIYDPKGKTTDKCIVIIAGHSYGGYHAVTTAEDLDKAPLVPVDYLVTHDPVTPIQAVFIMPKVPKNVAAADNFYQTTGMAVIPRGRKGFGAPDHDVSALKGWTAGSVLPPKPSNPPDDTKINWVHHMLVVTASYDIKLPNRNNVTWVEYAASLVVRPPGA